MKVFINETSNKQNPFEVAHLLYMKTYVPQPTVLFDMKNICKLTYD